MDAAERERRRRELAQFHRLFDLSAAHRDAALAELERVDAALARSLRRLLNAADADRRADAAAEAAGSASTSSPPAAGGAIGDVVGGRFRTRRLLGVGGMGEVYLAERIDGVEQHVALKRMRGDSPGSVARADRERRILARLTHPNIAGLVDTGLTEAGQPWFAMEYVEGEPVTAWCDRHALDLTQRARLFAAVCRAVQFAHRNLVLHRDLKPSNILVGADGRPKLLDFGIAKQLDNTDPQQTRTLALTPAYAAPEQLRGEPATTASDVYQLGLVLYELVAGVSSRSARDFAASRDDGAATLPRAEQALAGLAARDRAAAEAASKRRATGLDKLRRALRGDLGRILAKATADDPRERYDTAQAMGDDLERWAERLPVAAHRGSFAYRLRKLLRRHAAAAAAIALLAAGLVVVSVFALQRARSERVQREQVEQQRQRVETVLAFMRDVFRQSDPEQASDTAVGTDELVARAAAKLDQRDDLDAVTRGVLSKEIADVFSSTSRFDQAARYAGRALVLLEPTRDTHAEEYLGALETWLEAQTDAGSYAPQIEAIDRALPLARRVPDGARRWYPLLLFRRGAARAQLGQADAAEADLRAACAEYGEDALDADAGNAANGLAAFLEAHGDLRGALRLHLRVAEGDLGRLSRLVNRTNTSITYLRLGEPRKAIELLQPLIAPSEARLGAAHGNVRALRQWLAQAYASLGDYTAARDALGAAAPAPQSSWSATTQFTDRALRGKFELLELRPRSARAILQEASDRLREQPPSLTRARVDALLAEAMLQDGHCGEAAPVLDRAEADTRALVGARSYPTLGDVADSRGRCLLLARDWEGARAQFAVAVRQFEASQHRGSASALRSELHGLWADALATRDPGALERLREKRAALAAELGGDDRPPLWQLDLLLDALGRELGQPGIDAQRRRHAEDGLKALAGGAQLPHFVGLNVFS